MSDKMDINGLFKWTFIWIWERKLKLVTLTE